MFKPLSVLVISALVLTSCGTVRDSRLNPFNWFGRSQSVPVNTSAATGEANPLIPARRSGVTNILGIRTNDSEPIPYAGRPIATVTDLVIERRPGGAILRATGVADMPGPFDVRLVPQPDASTDGSLSFTLSAEQQPGPRNASVAARSVTVAVFLTDQELAGISDIRVAGRDNIQVSRR